MDKDTPFVLPGYFLECMKIRKILGISNDFIIDATGWDMVAYEQNPQLLSINQINRILDFFYKELNMPYLGLALGHQWRLSCHGLAGVSAMAQQTYGECLEAASRLCDKAFPAFAMEFYQQDNLVGLRISEAMSLAPYSHFYLEAIMVNFYNIFHFLLGDDVEPVKLAFSHEKPSYSHIYARYFKCSLEFGAPVTEFVVSRKLAARELLLANRGTAEMAEHTFMQSVPDMELNGLPKRLRLLLIQSMGAFPSLENAARKIGMSGRTLRRKLNNLGTNYQAEIEQLRQEFAINYLIKSNRSITDIALRLGYCDSSAFSRAFKGWTGETPRDYKKKYGDPEKNFLLEEVSEQSIADAEEAGLLPGKLERSIG